MDRVVGRIRDRVQGVLLGLAAGDRNGGPIRMAVRLAESLIECRGFHAGEIAASYLEWWRHGAFDTGPTSARVLTLVESGLSFRAAARRAYLETGGRTAGCNPAHRSAPLAMMPYLNPAQLAEYAGLEATLTHHHPLARDAAAAVVVICSELVRGAAWQDAVESACVGRQPETLRALRNQDPDFPRSGGFAPDVLGTAVHFVGSCDTLEAALEASLRFAGGANYSPVLVGSMGGARWGASSIPERFLHHCNILARVRLATAQLASRWID